MVQRLLPPVALTTRYDPLIAFAHIADCLASLLVAHKGQADMAISNAFGSNIFDILLGLGWPWMLQTCVVAPGTLVYPYFKNEDDKIDMTSVALSLAPPTTLHVRAHTSAWYRGTPFCTLNCVGAVHYCSDMGSVNASMVLLLGSFFFMLFVLKLSKWQLTPMLGVVMVVAYFVWAIRQVWADFQRQ